MQMSTDLHRLADSAEKISDFTTVLLVLLVTFTLLLLTLVGLLYFKCSAHGGGANWDRGNNRKPLILTDSIPTGAHDDDQVPLHTEHVA